MSDIEASDHVLVKVCGLTSVADALSCAEAGVDWLGLNFYEGSKRRVDQGIAAEIVASLPGGCEAVGLFVDRPGWEVAETAEKVGLRIVQLHGNETAELMKELGHLQVIRAFRIGDHGAIARMLAYLERAKAVGRTPDAVLVDADVAGEAGGTGQAIKVGLLDRLPPLPRLILAGGLTPENVGERVHRLRPWMVDVASGVESSPGRKDAARVAAFVRAARQNTI